MAFERFKQFNIDPLIAKYPADPRDSSKLCVIHRNSGRIEHKIFRDIPQYFKKGDTLVINNTKVFPAKLFARKTTGGRQEILLVRPMQKPNVWAALMRDFKEGRTLVFDDGIEGKIIGKTGDMEAVLEFNTDSILSYAQKAGYMPLPHYIERARKNAGLSASIETDKERYQTVYAKHDGSIAAPTAGFHFTPEILSGLKEMGVNTAFITLHVGWGTFKPLKTEPQQHEMLPELAEVPEESAQIINSAKSARGRIFSVGTTSTRTLESFAGEDGRVKSGRMSTGLFIYPGYKFKTVDCLITNFHFPDSTPLCLVSAFASEDLIYKAYGEAVDRKYRFYSFGDSMLVL